MITMDLLEFLILLIPGALLVANRIFDQKREDQRREMDMQFNVQISGVILEFCDAVISNQRELEVINRDLRRRLDKA